MNYNEVLRRLWRQCNLAYYLAYCGSTAEIRRRAEDCGNDLLQACNKLRNMRRRLLGRRPIPGPEGNTSYEFYWRGAQAVRK